MQSLNSLEHLAEVVSAPEDWRERINAAKNERYWVDGIEDFYALKASVGDEASLELKFSYMVNSLRRALNLDVTSTDARKVGVGGLLIEDNFDYFGKSDTCFQTTGPILATEAKLPSRFKLTSLKLTSFVCTQNAKIT